MPLAWDSRQKNRCTDNCFIITQIIKNEIKAFQYMLLTSEIKILDNHELHTNGGALYFLTKYRYIFVYMQSALYLHYR